MSKQSDPEKPICMSCGRVIIKTGLSEKRPFDIYEACSDCRRTRRIFDIWLPVVVTVAFITAIALNESLNIKSLGYYFASIGSILVVIDLSRLFMAAVVWDGGEQMRVLLPRANRKIQIGLVLMVLGFIAQMF